MGAADGADSPLGPLSLTRRDSPVRTTSLGKAPLPLSYWSHHRRASSTKPHSGQLIRPGNIYYGVLLNGPSRCELRLIATVATRPAISNHRHKLHTTPLPPAQATRAPMPATRLPLGSMAVLNGERGTANGKPSTRSSKSTVQYVLISPDLAIWLGSLPVQSLL